MIIFLKISLIYASQWIHLCYVQVAHIGLLPSKHDSPYYIPEICEMKYLKQ